MLQKLFRVFHKLPTRIKQNISVRFFFFLLQVRKQFILTFLKKEGTQEADQSYREVNYKNLKAYIERPRKT